MSSNRREELVGPFIQTFCSYGLDGTTTKKLAEAAGLSEAGLYVYFKNKEDILVTCVEEHFKKVKAETERLLAQHGKNLENFVIATFEYIKSILPENRFMYQVLSHPYYGSLITYARNAFVNGIKLQYSALEKLSVSKEDGIAAILLFNSALNNYILSQDEESFKIQINYLFRVLKLPKQASNA